MRDVKFTDKQLNQAKIQLIGQMAQIVENNSMHAQHQARSVLDYGKVIGFKDYAKEIEKITAAELQEISNEVLAVEQLSSLVYEQEKS